MISYADGDFKEMNLDKLECAMNLHSALNNDLSTNNTASRTVAAALLALCDIEETRFVTQIILQLGWSGWSISCLPFPLTETGW